ncbi:DNA translocase FtsK [Neobacillus pocheonensis]|uniref:DNA translocase FtsK n=1 Tax=Neobacillus pocheonensis TaxID=363869 RepID=A0ABT0W4X8_9BACI|nr:DNA translocase FtsK [Neobacillus pocheonensis]
MSWIQNFVHFFIKEVEVEVEVEIEEEVVDKGIHKDKKGIFPLHSGNEGVKDIEARISYHYPKGKARLFSFPEEVIKPKDEPIRKRKERPSERNKSEPIIEVPSVKKEIPKTRNEQSPQIRRPFHPTEIPSPVFGFNRPNNSTTMTKETELVEHELCHFLNKDFETHLEPLPVLEELLTETEVIKPSFQTPDVPIFVPVETMPSQPIKEEELLAVKDEAFSREMDRIQVSNEASSNQFKEEVLSDHKEEIAIDQPEPPKPKRSHLPFNVMMLKQDKQKWEERKKRRVEQLIPIEPIRNHQVEKEVESTPIVEVQEEEKQLALESNLYEFPISSLLNPPVAIEMDTEWIQFQEELLNKTLQNFNVGASVVNVTQGPSVTRFEVQPEPGVKVNKVTNLSDDIKLSLAARDIRIEAPIPGKHTIGIEVPNQKSRPVFINEIIQSNVFRESPSPLTAVLGLDISGKPIVTDLKKMPHGLIAGATGSGKSVCINSILISLLYKASPDDLKLLLIDPKMVELAPYNRIPHLVSPVITDVKAATASLKWAVDEMERRYELFAHTGVRDINRFNELAIKHKRYSDKLPFIVIIIDELADLMMMSPADVEEAICRIAQKARACGIHLIVATQRPSVDVITGLIKANIPTRIAFSVSSQVDSRTIIDISGAEKLLGRGDMLFLENGSSKPVRLQGTFVTDDEIDIIVAHVREQREPDYLFEQEELLKKAQVTEEEDELFYEACEFIIDQGGASTSSLQRRFKMGYNRAARLMDMLENQGYISSAKGSKPREVLITEADLESLQEASTIV